MASTRWKLTIHHLGETRATHATAIVDADDWPTAFRDGRHQLGEAAEVPSDAACEVASDGTVTVVDGARQRRYILTPDQDVGSPAAPSAERAPAEPATGDKPLSRARHTLPYSPERAAALQREFEAARQVQAALAPHDPLPRPNLRAMPEGGEPRRSAVPPAPSQTTAAAAVASIAHPRPEGAHLPVLASRDVEPSPSSPLTYRERAFLLAGGASRALMEQLLTDELGVIQRALEGRPQGKYVTLALFDQPFEGVPMRPPLATLEWMDWRGDPVFTHATDLAEAPRPLVGAPPANTTTATGRRAEGTDADHRLSSAFEAMPDLHAQPTPVAAFAFAVALLERLVPVEAISACLYDIDTHEFRFVSLTGPGAEERRASAVPASAGLFGEAAQKSRDVLLVRDAARAAQFDPAVDGRVGLEAREVVYLPLRRQQQHLGMLQLINRRHARPHFTDTDLAILHYVASQLTEFLLTRRSVIH